MDDWEEYAKILRHKSEQKATEAEQAGAGKYVGQMEILSLLQKLDGITYDVLSGEVLDEELVKKAGMIEVETLKKH